MMRVKQVQQAQNCHVLCTCARALPVRRSTRAYTCELARDSRRHSAPSALHLVTEHTGRTTSTSDQCYLACHLARVVFISSMPRERNARSPYQKSPKPKAYPRPRIRLHAPTTRQARLLYPLKSYRLAPLLAKIINPSLIQSHRPAGHLQHPLHGQAAGAKDSVYAKGV